jgi:hypothetical protein
MILKIFKMKKIPPKCNKHLSIQRKNMIIDLNVFMAWNGNGYPVGWFKKSFDVG